MAPHARKLRKLAHGTDHGGESYISNVASRFADDKEYVASDDDDEDGPGTSATGPSLVSKFSKMGGPPIDSPDGSLLVNETYRTSKTTLQVKALLEEVRPNYASLLAGAEPLLRKLKANIEDFPAKEPLTVRLSLRSKVVHPTDVAEFAGRGGGERVQKGLQDHHPLSRSETFNTYQIYLGLCKAYGCHGGWKLRVKDLD